MNKQTGQVSKRSKELKERMDSKGFDMLSVSSEAKEGREFPGTSPEGAFRNGDRLSPLGLWRNGPRGL